MYKQKGSGLLGLIFSIILLGLMGYAGFYFFLQNSADRSTALIPIQEFHFDEPSQQLKITLHNKYTHDVGDMRLVCDVRMKSGSPLSGVATIFNRLSKNATETVNVLNLQHLVSHGDELNNARYENIPMSNIRDISGCRITSFKEFE